MVRHNITRWHPVTCKCILETVTEYSDNNEERLTDPRFLLVNDVCNRHYHLCSVYFRPNHEALAREVLDYIEEAKTLNINQANDVLSQVIRKHRNRPMLIHEQFGAVEQVKYFNALITEEWNELVIWPHAFDEHIYNAVLKENLAVSVMLVVPHILG